MYHQVLHSPFWPHGVFMCFVWIWEQTAIISLYSINWLVFITETECVYCAVRTGSLYSKPPAFASVAFLENTVHIGFASTERCKWERCWGLAGVWTPGLRLFTWYFRVKMINVSDIIKLTRKMRKSGFNSQSTEQSCNYICNLHSLHCTESTIYCISFLSSDTLWSSPPFYCALLADSFIVPSDSSSFFL